MDIEQARLLCRELWNPIGIRMRTGSAEDKPYWLPISEYDPYLVRMIAMISEGADHDRIVEYAREVEINFLGLSNPKGDKTEFVRRLFSQFEHGDTTPSL